jgi:hypothetical protein
LVAITATSNVDARFLISPTVDRTASDHRYASVFASLTCSPVTAGVGFTIYATSIEQLTGTFNVSYHY